MKDILLNHAGLYETLRDFHPERQLK